MDKVTGISMLKQALARPEVSRSSIGRALGIDASQVSRIAAGHFVKLDGHALRVCKYAQQILEGTAGVTHAFEKGFEVRFRQLESLNPKAAKAVSELLDALLAGGASSSLQ
ncbi:hypothetical protein [Stenotrophomonas maltophilia]|uniref:hypothetical protein n=1 Tax=Stenotrophomonas maltophilia TaxID=40324 RepID=UPI0039C345E6